MLNDISFMDKCGVNSGSGFSTMHTHIVSKVVRLSKNKAMIFYKKFIDCYDEMGIKIVANNRRGSSWKWKAKTIFHGNPFSFHTEAYK